MSSLEQRVEQLEEQMAALATPDKRKLEKAQLLRRIAKLETLLVDLVEAAVQTDDLRDPYNALGAAETEVAVISRRRQEGMI